MEDVLQYSGIFLFAFARLGGMIFANPLFGRRNVPMRVRAGLVLALTLLIGPNLDAQAVTSFNSLEMMAAILRETAYGICFGLVFQIFFYMLFVAGDLMDTAFGLSMSKIFDPVNGLQISVMGQVIQIVFALYFFATGSHLIMVKIFAYSFELVPAGAQTIVWTEVVKFLLSLFESAFVMAVKLALPFLAAEFLVEAAMGILMKLIPQIHVFVINMQCKILTGLVLMMLFAQPMGNFIDHYAADIMQEMQNLMTIVS